MNGETLPIALAGGIETRLPQQPESASIAENLAVDPISGGWSTRVGWEPFRPNPTAGFAPFNNCGPIYSLHVAQELGGGARQHILFEESGNLHLLYDAAGVPVLRTLKAGRHVPTAAEAGSWYTDIGGGIVVTNGVDRPVLVRPWPLGTAGEASSTVTQCIRDLGFVAPPPPPEPTRVTPIGSTIASSTVTGGGATTLWCPADTTAIGGSGGRWGVGFAKNSGSDPGNEAQFGYAVSFISDTGSESPLSTISTVQWELPAGATGLRYAVAVRIPRGPRGTVARRIWRTNNFSPDFDFVGDQTLYLAATVRNNVEDMHVDVVRSYDVGQEAPELPTAPLPAPRARFSAVFAGCLWLDGGIDDPLTIYHSQEGLLEQFAPDGYIQLGGQGGGVTGMVAHYNQLVVFREAGVDVVEYVQDNGLRFTVTTISTDVACRSPHAIITVPDLGLVFPTTDGVYALTGGQQGGSSYSIIRVGAGFPQVAQRFTLDCLPRAVGAWSARTREVHLYVPVDGSDRPNLGLVLHTDRLERAPDQSAWTTRTGFPVGAIAPVWGGTLVFGHHTGVEAGANSPAGVFVISARRAAGGTLADNLFVPSPPPVSRYRTAWQDFGDLQLTKKVLYVTVWVLTTGRPQVAVRWLKDFNQGSTGERVYLSQPPDQAQLPVFDTAVFGQVNWSEERLVPLRVAVAPQACSSFAFEFSTQDDLVFVGYELVYQASGNQVIQGVRA